MEYKFELPFSWGRIPVRVIDNEDGEEAEQRIREIMRGILLIVTGRLREAASVNQLRSWVTDDSLLIEPGFLNQPRSFLMALGGDLLNPCNAVPITLRKLYELADRTVEPELTPEADGAIWVPRIPIDVAEARAIMAMLMLADGGVMYAGYSSTELELLPNGGAQIRHVVDPHTGQQTIEVRTR